MARQASYSLAAPDDPEHLEYFYNDAHSINNNSGDAAFLSVSVPSRSEVKGDLYSQSSSIVTNERGENSKGPTSTAARTGEAVSRYLEELWKRLSPTQYDVYFQLTAGDFFGRICRAFIPRRRLLERPPPPARASTTEASDEDDDVVTDVPETSVASERPFNDSVDLYGPLWLTATLVLSIAVGANALEALRVLSGRSTRDLSALSALDFRHLTQASALVYTYSFGGAAATVVAKRYYGDPVNAGFMHAMFVYGYAATPLVPAVLLCAIPHPSAHWLILAVATCTSSWFLYVNLWQRPRVASLEDKDSDAYYSYGPDVQEEPAPSNVRWMQGACIVVNVLYVVILKWKFF